MDTEDNSIPNSEPRKKRTSPKVGFFKKNQYGVNFANAVFTGFLLITTFYFYYKSSNLNDAQFKLTQKQFAEQHKKDSLANIKDVFDQIEQASRDSNQAIALHSVTLQSEAIQGEAKIQKRLLEIGLLANRPSIELNDFYRDTAQNKNGFWLGFVNKGGRTVGIKKLIITVYSPFYQYYNFYKDTIYKKINANSVLSVHVGDMPAPIIKDYNTLYHAYFLIHDIATKDDYPVDYYFETPENKPNGLGYFAWSKAAFDKLVEQGRENRGAVNIRFNKINMGFPTDTIDEHWIKKHEHDMSMIFRGGDSPLPFINSANYSFRILNDGDNLAFGTLSFENISSTYPFRVLIDNKISRKVKDKVDWLAPEDFDDNYHPQSLEPGYHTIKFVYAFNEKYFRLDVVEIIQGKDLKIYIK